MRGVILSAGLAKRVGGGCKALLEVAGRTMLDWQLDAGLNRCDEVVVVTRTEHLTAAWQALEPHGVPGHIRGSDTGGGPARALTVGLSDGYEGPLVVAYADAWFGHVPDRGGDWAGCHVGRGFRHWDVVHRDGRVTYEPVEVAALVCVGVYRFDDANRVRRTIDWLDRRTHGELHMGGVLNELGGVWFESMPDWQDVGDHAAINQFQPPTEVAA